MIKWHITNKLTEMLHTCSRFKELTEQDEVQLYDEVRNATLHNLIEKIFEKYLYNWDKVKIKNTNNLMLLWVLGVTDEKPATVTKVLSMGSMADFDIDFSKEKRDLVKKYLVSKYGQDYISDVVTFSMLGAKAAIRGAQRALGVAIDAGTKIAKQIPNDPGISIKESIDNSETLRDMIKNDPISRSVIDLATKFEGLPNSLSVHACATIISDNPISEYMPQMVSTKKDNSTIITQFEYYDVEAIGGMKFDFLGLKTLDVIDQTIALVKSQRGIDIKLDEIDVNDKGIYTLLNNGHTVGVFQFDGTAAAFLPKVKPDNINEISDLTSLLRPGPLSMGLLDVYSRAKFRNEKYDYGLHDKKIIEKMWEICASSYGLLIFQEQLIKCFVEFSDFNEIEADNARRATGKILPFMIGISYLHWGKSVKA